MFSVVAKKHYAVKLQRQKKKEKERLAIW